MVLLISGLERIEKMSRCFSFFWNNSRKWRIGMALVIAFVLLFTNMGVTCMAEEPDNGIEQEVPDEDMEIVDGEDEPTYAIVKNKPIDPPSDPEVTKDNDASAVQDNDKSSGTTVNRLRNGDTFDLEKDVASGRGIFVYRDDSSSKGKSDREDGDLSGKGFADFGEVLLRGIFSSIGENSSDNNSSLNDDEAAEGNVEANEETANPPEADAETANSVYDRTGEGVEYTAKVTGDTDTGEHTEITTGDEEKNNIIYGTDASRDEEPDETQGQAFPADENRCLIHWIILFLAVAGEAVVIAGRKRRGVVYTVSAADGIVIAVLAFMGSCIWDWILLGIGIWVIAATLYLTEKR